MGGRAVVRGRRTGYGRRKVGLYKGKLVETKFHDIHGTDAPATSNVSQWEYVERSLNSIPQGTTAEERIGQKIVVTAINIDMTVYPPAGRYGASGPVRWALVLLLDKQYNGGTVGASDIFEDTADPGSMLSMKNKHRFKILKRWDMVFNPNVIEAALTGGGAPSPVSSFGMQVIRYYKKCRITIYQDGTAGGVSGLANIRSNNISLWACGHRTTVVNAHGATYDSTSAPDMNITKDIRVRFVDS